ncbi:MAG TPA: TM0106 family RecB-like putative nuclease [Candidatus Limnocylindrales bacterium]
MQLIDGRPVYAATDLVGFLACDHRLELERAALAGLVAKPIRNDPSIELVAKRGIEHELRYLEDLRDQGLRIVEIDKDGSAVAPLEAIGEPVPRDAGAELRAAAEQTVAAMRGGADVVYQATFFDGTWRGHADFLLRRNHTAGEPDSALGPWHYEVADTKLARHVKASAILQICSYVEQLTAVQGQQPEYLYVVLGGRERPTDQLRVDDYMAYYRRVKADFEAAVGLRGDPPPPAYPPIGTYPEPVEHCDVCRWAVMCKAKRRADDDLSLVAGASSRQRRALKARDVATRRGLAVLPLPMDPKLEGVGAGALERIQEQARIQVQSEDRHEVLWELLPLDRDADGNPVPDRGLLGLPEPSPGDLFLDLEGDPFALDDGIDYLFGILEPRLDETDPRWLPADGPAPPAFHAIWSLDASGAVTWAAEKEAFERTMDLMIERLDRDPTMHVYHYAAYERTALGRLAQRHGTREEQVDRLLRGGVLVDLFKAVRQGIRAGVESYSIKRIEPLYALERSVELKDAGSSIVAFETWLELGADGPVEDATRILDGIAGYNRDDVVSNWRLRDWLENRRRDLEESEGIVLRRPTISDGSASADLTEREQEVAALSDILTANVPDDPVERATRPEAAGQWLLAQMLTWHRREDKSAWWRYYALLGMTDDELIEEREPLAGLELVASQPMHRSIAYTFSFPPQDHRIGEDSTISDPRTRKGAGEVVGVDDVARTITIKRGPSFADVALPRSIVPQGVVPSKELAESLLRTGHLVAATPLAAGTTGGAEPAPPSVRDLLLRTSPDAGQGPGAPLRRPGETAVDAATRIVGAMPGGVLPVQGPPGSGKTYTGARMIVRLVADGKRVGVVANSHKVIGKVLDEVAKAAAELRQPVRIGQKPKTGQRPTHAHATLLKENADVEAALRARTVDVVGAVAWTWCRPEFARQEPTLDVLVVDEAGQMSLANVLACAPSARTIVLLGDPQQLDQPTQGSHPPGADRSALSHLLADPAYLRPDRATIRPEEGLFLEETWRLHPEICDFTSRAFYAGRLRPRDGLEGQAVIAPRSAGPLSGTGLRYLPVPHAGNDTDSPEEATTIVELVKALLETNPTWIDRDGREAPLTIEDIVIVAPYNAHVGAIERAAASAGLPSLFAGTVDKFQGQEAPISIYALGTSSPEDAPRGMEFLYSLNRLNVATSRARCVAAIVMSPALVRAPCHTPRQMRLANGLCLAVEAATGVARGHGAPEAASAAEPALVLFPHLANDGMPA